MHRLIEAAKEMIARSRRRKLAEDICLAVGHEIRTYPMFGYDGGQWSEDRCDRCELIVADNTATPEHRKNFLEQNFRVEWTKSS